MARFPSLRHDEGEGRRSDQARMDGNCVLCSHVEKHASEPVLRHRRDEIWHDAELRAAKRCRHRVASERQRRKREATCFSSPTGNMIGQERHVDISLSNGTVRPRMPFQQQSSTIRLRARCSGRDRVSVMQTLVDLFADREARRNRTKLAGRAASAPQQRQTIAEHQRIALHHAALERHLLPRKPYLGANGLARKNGA